MAAAIEAWRDAGLVWRPRCNDELHRLQVVVAQPDRFTDLCLNRPSSAGGTLYACSTHQYEYAWPWSFLDGDRVPLLVISALQPEDHRRALVAHEAMHWLGDCSGKGIDHDHADDFVWRGVLSAAIDRIVGNPTKNSMYVRRLNSSTEGAKGGASQWGR